MSIEAFIDNSVFRSHIGPAWLDRFNDEGAVFVIIEPHSESNPFACEHYLAERRIPFRKRLNTDRYLIGGFPIDGFLDSFPLSTSEYGGSISFGQPIIKTLAREPGPIKFIWYDAPMVIQTEVSVPLVGAADPRDLKLGLDYGC